MKTKVLTIALLGSLFLLSSLSSYSQTEKGTWMLGGYASTGLTFESDNNSFGIIVSPGIGYFMSDNLAIGLGIPLLLSTEENYRYIAYGISPFIRYYFGTPSELMFFVTGSFGIDGWSSKYDDTTNSSSSITGKAGVGCTYFLNESIGLETILGYTYDKPKDYDPTSGISLSIGFQIYFSR
jgi:outer membrane protein W